MSKEKTFNDTGEIIELQSISKSTLSGNHALKTIYTSHKESDNALNSYTNYTCIRYEFFRNSSIIQVVIKFNQDYTINSMYNIFKGFSFISIDD